MLEMVGGRGQAGEEKLILTTDNKLFFLHLIGCTKLSNCNFVLAAKTFLIICFIRPVVVSASRSSSDSALN